MERAVFFADVLGFSSLAQRPRAVGAVDALSDLATVLSSENEMARLVRSDVWTERYGLSDSIFLVAEEPRSACAAAAEIFFNLAYINVGSAAPVLLRGAVTAGDVRRTDPLFPESASANLVGKAVVEAVALESSGVKGPRLLVSETVAQALETDRQAKGGVWALDRTESGVAEILWLLPAGSPHGRLRVNGTMIGEICGAALDLFLEHHSNPGIGHHYTSYLRLVLRALLRLRELSRGQARHALEVAALEDKERMLISCLREHQLEDSLADLELLLH